MSQGYTTCLILLMLELD